ncbi:hypothetical protein DYI24_23980 [Rhodopseudomonas sp. BR0C11]|uniref:hypothetical protein n=1 Tax=Rhodopseudomonas sp. BR0C11 TaxID=2269370 RepID=UPI0013DFA1BB|nr:hypothetical protein [Rhodopseudomonas sp. BR0C11]NEV80099.1 hypothetical protein [Rhodopseudomonas sp. BR0C11]
MTMRAGDHVLHGPTGEEWVVAYVDGDRLAWCGWPEGEAMVSDCEMIKKATDEEHVEWLQEIAKSAEGKRARMARIALDSISLPAEQPK